MGSAIARWPITQNTPRCWTRSWTSRPTFAPPRSISAFEISDSNLRNGRHRYHLARHPESDFPPFVGREAELARLEEALHRRTARHGAGALRDRRGRQRQDDARAGVHAPPTGTQRFSHARHRDRDIKDRGGSRGTCNAQVGAGDPYLPFRETLRLLMGDFDVPITDGVLPRPTRSAWNPSRPPLSRPSPRRVRI